jgi:hypothetical protein
MIFHFVVVVVVDETSSGFVIVPLTVLWGVSHVRVSPSSGGMM